MLEPSLTYSLKPSYCEAPHYRIFKSHCGRYCVHWLLKGCSPVIIIPLGFAKNIQIKVDRYGFLRILLDSGDLLFVCEPDDSDGPFPTRDGNLLDDFEAQMYCGDSYRFSWLPDRKTEEEMNADNEKSRQLMKELLSRKNKEQS